MTNKLDSLNFTFVARSAPLNGPRASDAWNDSFTELATDLATITREWNNKLVSLMSTIPYGNLDSSVNAYVNGLDGRTLWVDSSVSSASRDKTFYVTNKSRPATIQEALETLYTYVNNQVESVSNTIANTSSGLTSGQKEAIGDAIFDSALTSSSSSIDGKSENNRLNIVQLATDLYGAGYSLDNDGVGNLTQSVFAMVDALLELHNGNWDDDVTLDHSGVSIVVAQSGINSSSPGNDTYAGSPSSIEDDLNEIRTEIRTLKGTAGWGTSLSNLYAAGADSLEELLTSVTGTASKTAANPWGYHFDDIDGLGTTLDAIRDFTGQSTHTDASPTYSSLNYLSSGDSLQDAVATLDSSMADFITAADLLSQDVDFGQDVEITSSGYGLIMSSPDGTRWRLQVDNSGALTTTVVV